MMATLYLTEQQAWVGLEGECLIIRIPETAETGLRAKSERKKIVPLNKIEAVMVLGDITLTTPALAALLKAKVAVSYLTRYGRYLGSLNPELTKNSVLRLAQHTAYANPQKRLDLARPFVSGKLKNMRTILMRYHRTYPDNALTTQADSLKRCILAAERAELKLVDLPGEESELNYNPEMEGDEVKTGRMNGLGSLLGCEGAGSAAYFSVFGRLVKCDWPHGFTKRVRRPPTDPVNALLSFGYVILMSQIAGVVTSVGFDPYIGYLHSSKYGKPALALDLMEEFRPVIVDSVVLSLFNNRQLEARHFRQELNGCRMSEDAKKLFLQKFEERMQEVITHPYFNYKATYRYCLELQVRLLSKYLTGDVEQYVPFTVR